MPEKGWSVLTVRGPTALKIRGMAKAKGMTVDEVLEQLLNSSSRPSPMGQWSTCETCGSKVKTKNLQEHTVKVHPDKLTVNLQSLS